MNLNKTIVDPINKIQLSNFLFFYIIEIITFYWKINKEKRKGVVDSPGLEPGTIRL
jgi:hypothetical protein